jgi:hypothetical protein
MLARMGLDFVLFCATKMTIRWSSAGPIGQRCDVVSIPMVLGGQTDLKSDKMKVNFMPNVYAILGESNTGKSTTVRALTGVSQRSHPWSVATSPTVNINFYIQMKALQEDDIKPQDFLNKIANHNHYSTKNGHRPVNDILIPLRISGIKGYPDGIDYLKHFASVGWTVRQIVVLGAATSPSGLAALVPKHRIHLISYLHTMPPANKIASYIRGWWSWL